MNCIVENNNIFKLEYGQKECVGVTVIAYKELENSLEEAIVKAEEYKNKAEEYRKKLVELGVIQVPKTPEEIQAEILNGLNNLTNFVQKLNSRLEVLENEPSKNIANSKATRDRTSKNHGGAGENETVS